MDYSVRSHLFGKKEIVFKCDRCHDELKAPLEDAGLQQTCPNCGIPFITPATDELNAEKEEQRQAREREQAERDRAATEAKVLQERRHQESMQHSQIKPAPPPPELVWYGAMYCNSCGYQWQARRNTPPARCPSCGKREVQAVKVPKRTTGCLTIIVVTIPAALILIAHSWR